MWPFTFTRPSVDEEIEKREIQNLVEPRPMPMMVASPIAAAPSTRGRLLKTLEIIECYGQAGDASNHVNIKLPYPFRIAWAPNSTTNSTTCHKKVADSFMNVFNDLLRKYGAARIKELGIDLFGGLGNFRPQRGLEAKYDAAMKAKNFQLAATYLSRHSWWIAIDLDPARNQLKQTAKTAQFAKPEYAIMQDTFYDHGFIGYGRERNNDFMHFEIGVLL